MKIKLEIETGNAAFGDQPEQELARIFNELSDRLMISDLSTLDDLVIRDFNGNRVGKFSVEE